MTDFSHEVFMERCFELALNGAGAVAPNPMVGAVVVHEGKIIGEGNHEYFGGPHAEVNALRSVPDEKKAFLKDSILYVNLEPCCHFGKTPPCTDLIIKSGIRKVAFSNADPHPTSGGGATQLRNAGCEVISGIREQEGAWLNRRFFTFVGGKRPYIILKWAQTADGFFTKNSNEQHWITSEQSKRLVHRWRSEEAAVLCGTNTIAVDNPQLTNRLWIKGKQPLRVVPDKSLRLPSGLHVFDSSAPTLVFTEKQKTDSDNIRYVQIPFDGRFLPAMLEELSRMGVLSIMVEGGAKLLNAFISESLWDEARIFTSEAVWGMGVEAPVVKGSVQSAENTGCDSQRTILPARLS